MAGVIGRAQGAAADLVLMETRAWACGRRKSVRGAREIPRGNSAEDPGSHLSVNNRRTVSRIPRRAA